MARLCEGGNELPGSLKASRRYRPAKFRLPTAEVRTTELVACFLFVAIAAISSTIVNCPKTGLNLTSDTKKALLMRQLGQEIMRYGGQFLSPSIAYIAH
ncbi:hypothetical protein ANN_01817 [Periplaneta americana]|uniref:Uncharacterized protein n=1 Tax=Periplaneta americana TaxID=6978 RepID=A0ABQ8TX07_PERAM|nr:hypothetical protein ANN_01817 [Periplaneta americana]